MATIYVKELKKATEKIATLEAEITKLRRELEETRRLLAQVMVKGQSYDIAVEQRDALAAALRNNLTFQEQQLHALEAAIISEEWIGLVSVGKQALLDQAKSRLALWRLEIKNAGNAALAGIPAPPTEVKND